MFAVLDVSFAVNSCINHGFFYIYSIYKRKANFLAKLKCSDNVLIGLFLNIISTELSSLQLNYA